MTEQRRGRLVTFAESEKRTAEKGNICTGFSKMSKSLPDGRVRSCRNKERVQGHGSQNKPRIFGELTCRLGPKASTVCVYRAL